jgi:2-polyprenyl-3-methyl-5-hydroxy-6-metoxy-1,4-benzoquinol methylase
MNTETSTLPTAFQKAVDEISKINIFQKKALKKVVENADRAFLDFAEDILNRLNRARQCLGGQDDNFAYLARAYVNYTKAIRAEEMYFAKHRNYRHSDYAKVYEEVYGRDDYMIDYIFGLGMTQVFWPNHRDIFLFFKKHFLPQVSKARIAAEVGVGHGLFHSDLHRNSPELRSVMLDVSDSSLKGTQAMMQATGLDSERARAVKIDVQKEIPLEDNSLDVLLFGEIIEHLEKGKNVFAALSKKMKKEGLCFFTTAANAPAEDHILLFRNTDEIRQVIREAHWKIEEEHIGTLAGMSLEKAEAEGHNINYAARLSPER